ncbi:uncharacterized protein LOC113204482 isoform X2 [Frankliniella occidentalis]|uniref:Uncharacterized protein LOC113204482 isoform X2 n=1 Tax=Frankliniella occidentalis TaxID=133901 RepID=A0A6J1S2J1_FRAOC|nr:uncharacterized protein LOC113204482 isoform X2 [Frankliniella occidentalis]
MAPPSETSEQRTPQTRRCLRCLKHEKVVFRKGHNCPFQDCKCVQCTILTRKYNKRNQKSDCRASARPQRTLPTLAPAPAPAPGSGSNTPTNTTNTPATSFICVPVLTLDSAPVGPGVGAASGPVAAPCLEFLVTVPADHKSAEDTTASSRGACRLCRAHGEPKYHRQSDDCPHAKCTCSARCRSLLAKRKWLAALKQQGQEQPGREVPEQTAPLAEVAGVQPATSSSAAPGGEGQSRQRLPTGPVGLAGDESIRIESEDRTPTRRLSVVVTNEATARRLQSPPRRPSVEVVELEEPPPRPPSVEVIEAPPAVPPPLVVLDEPDEPDEPDAELRCPTYPTCQSVFDSEEELQDHVDSVHMQLVPLRTLKKLFQMMHLAGQSIEELADQFEEHSSGTSV